MRFALFLLLGVQLSAQIFVPPLPAEPAQAPQPSTNINQKLRIPQPNPPEPDTYRISADDQTKAGPWYHLRGSARVESVDMELKADEIDYNEDTGDAEARGNVQYENFARGEILKCERAEYNYNTDTGKFYDVNGTAKSQIVARPGLLTTQNPFYFQGRWAERLKDHYIIHNGFITDCIVPRPWWTLRGREFDILANENGGWDHAVAHRSWFYLKRLPVFYTPWFYKSLKKHPRRSGILLPTLGNSSAHGETVGFGYYWAINRSYDLTYNGVYYSLAGLANHLEFRGKINSTTNFDLTVFGVKSTQQTAPDTPSLSGYRVNLRAVSDLGDGWTARGVVDYLSSFYFLQQFTSSFNEAVYSETHSVGFITKHWGDFGVDFVAQRDVNFQSTTPGDTIEIRKLPSAEVAEREHEIDIKQWPFWFSFQGSAGLMDRSQPGFQTSPFVDRVDIAPQLTTAFRWKDFQLIPTVGVRETQYDASIDNGSAISRILMRNSHDLTLALVLPSIERIFNAPKWMGDKVKHVIEPRINYKYVGGINNFNDIVRFDENDIISNTNQMEFSLTNRLLTKDKNGTVSDFLTWQVRWEKYFDPTFGGAVVACGTGAEPACQRNIVWSESDLTGFAFLDGPRGYSPVVSALRLQTKVNIEWRTDYDPLRHGIVNSTVSVDGRIRKYFWSIGHAVVRTDPLLTPNADQMQILLGYGNPNSRGWNYGGSAVYDYRQGVLKYWQAQVTYNTDCCGFSGQYRRFSVGTRDDTQFEVAFSISNIGTAGNLKKQDRIF